MKNRSPSTEIVDDLVHTIVGEIVRNEYMSYDPSDLQETKLGKAAKQLWNEDSKFGLFLLLPIQLTEILFPQIRYLISKKRQHPICYAHVGTACLLLSHLPKASNRQLYQQYADYCLEQMLSMARETASGIGWGINVEWQTKGGLLPANTPCYTQTAYCFEFIAFKNQLAPSPTLLEYLRSISEHIANDYLEFRDGDSDLLVSGYSILDTRVVLNAISYRSMILFSAFELFGDKKYLEKAVEALQYVLRCQGSNGEWFYSKNEAFIDGYHTCFILKNLLKIEKSIKNIEMDLKISSEIRYAISDGLAYYKSNLFDGDEYPIPFSITNKPVLYKYDSYDLAEAINLFVMTGDIDRVEILLDFFMNTMRTSKGLTRFRYYPWLSTVTEGLSFSRYANTAMLLALAKYLTYREIENEG